MRSTSKHTTPLQLSVIIVNYNVCEFLNHALVSLQKAMKGIRGEIIVVDNASDDGSVEMIRKRFPSVHLIANEANLGFARANNLALRKAKGRFLLLINPDTLVQEDTLRVMMKFFEENPDAGLAGCTILNPDGSFQLPCRRSFPTPWVAFTKISGLSALFPKSRLFGRYNLTYLSPDETYELDAVSGSFMMVRREAYEQVGGLDEDFFMYGEDLDWCFRIQRAGWKNYYVPTTKIIHYKGESTRRSSLNEIRTFYQAMHLFVRKHHSSSHLFALFLRLAISMTSRLAMVRAFARSLGVAVLDFLLVDISIFIAELLWFGTWMRLPIHAYPIVYTIPAVVVVASLYAAGVYSRHRMSASRTIVATLVSFVFISALVFFFKDYGFSRGVTIIAGWLSMVFLPSWRLALRAVGKSTPEGRKSLFGRRTVLVGTDASAQELLRRLRTRVGAGYDVLGFIGVNRKRIGESLLGLPILGSVDNIGKVIHDLRVSDVIFSTQALSYSDILSVISRTREQTVNFHLVPTTLEVIIGKGSIDSLDELPLVQITYNIEKPGNRIAKRGFDLIISFLLLISVYPFVYWKKRIRGESRSRFILKLPSVFSGRYSFVGPPDHQRHDGRFHLNGAAGSLNLGKPGLTGLIQLQGNRSLAAEEREQYNLYYAKNQSIALDTEILLKTILQKNDQPVETGSHAELPQPKRTASGGRMRKSAASGGSAEQGA